LFLFIDAVCDCPALSSAIMKYSTNAIIRWKLSWGWR
jgi:hypothetical protein